MEVFRIHAGVTNEMIIDKMRYFIKRSDECSKQDSKKRLWIFLDEFNTTPSIGLFKEIVCERTLLGEPLPSNMVFLGACNPQRRRELKNELNYDISINTYYPNIRLPILADGCPLLYSVIPIPETMLEHIWDYGSLDEHTEKNYIEAIIKVCEKIMDNPEWFKCMVKTICSSQKFIRDREDVSPRPTSCKQDLEILGLISKILLRSFKDKLHS